MFSLINSLLLANGSTPLGFVNPALYDMAQVDPQAFYDVDQGIVFVICIINILMINFFLSLGNNNCNRAYCCTYGWEYVIILFFFIFLIILKYSRATHGWDPVTGLGTPVFSRFVDYFLKVKGQKN